MRSLFGLGLEPYCRIHWWAHKARKYASVGALPPSCASHRARLLRRCVTYKQGKSAGRHGCFGRVALHEIITTVRVVAVGCCNSFRRTAAVGCTSAPCKSLVLARALELKGQPRSFRAMQVVGRAEPHNLRLGHPEQKRVMTIRENARTQVRCTLLQLRAV